MSDDVTQPDIDPADDDFEAHGLKEGIAVVLGAGALAVAGTANAYVAPPNDDGGRVGITAPAKPLAKQTAKKKAAKKKTAKSVGVSGGLDLAAEGAVAAGRLARLLGDTITSALSGGRRPPAGWPRSRRSRCARRVRAGSRPRRLRG